MTANDTASKQEDDEMYWYAIQPDGCAYMWRVVNISTGKLIASGLTRERAFQLKDSLQRNQEKRNASMEAGQ